MEISSKERKLPISKSKVVLASLAMKTLNEDLQKYLLAKNFLSFTDIQKKAIPLILNEKSLHAFAPTGTGKTLAFGLGLVELFKRKEKQGISYKVLVLSPTRELASQTFQVLKELSHYAKLRVRLLLGGKQGKRQKRNFCPDFDILVAVPGRLSEQIHHGKNLEKFKDLVALVLDEADQLIDMGFTPGLETIMNQIKPTQVLLFSATKAKVNDKIAKLFSKLPFQEVKGEHVFELKKNVTTYNVFLRQDEKLSFCSEFLKRMPKGKGLVFFNKKQDIAKVFEILTQNFPKRVFISLHGELLPKERKKAMQVFLREDAVMFCTDIVARGIDIADIAWVLNYDLPFEAIYYVHRAGRVARGIEKGSLYNFVTHKDISLIKRINEAIRNQTALKLQAIIPKILTSSMKKKKIVSGVSPARRVQNRNFVKKRATKRTGLGKKKNLRKKKF